MENLQSFDQEVQNASPATWGKTLPDGKYICSLRKIEIKRNHGNDGFHLHLQLQVAIGAYKNRTIHHWRAITHNESVLAWLKRDLLAVGYLGKISELENHAEELLGEIVLTELRTYKGEQTVVLTSKKGGSK